MRRSSVSNIWFSSKAQGAIEQPLSGLRPQPSGTLAFPQSVATRRLSKLPLATLAELRSARLLGQAATEYLVLMSVVLGIALICITLLVWPTGTTKDVKTSQSDIKCGIAKNAVPDIMQGMVAYYKFDEGSGTTAADIKGGRTGTLANGPTWAIGKSGTALHTAGGADYVNVADYGAIVSDSTDLTVNLFVKYDDFTNSYNVPVTSGTYFSSSTPQAAGWAFWTGYSSGNVKFTVAKNSGTYATTSTSTLVVGQWYMLTGTFQKATGTAKLYVNGVLKGSSTNAGVDSFQGDRLEMPASSNAGPTNRVTGSIDEVLIYNRVLSDDEIKFLAQYPGCP